MERSVSILRLIALAGIRILKNIIGLIRGIYWALTYLEYRQKYTVSKSFHFNGEGIILYGRGQIYGGECSYIGRASSIQSTPGTKVVIGRKCSLSHFVSIYTSNHVADKDFSTEVRRKAGDVLIGDYCWIGIKSTILGPVVIGENTVVGSNSVVSRDLPPHAIALGIPAKVIKFKSYVSLDEQKNMAKQYSGVISDNLKTKLMVS